MSTSISYRDYALDKLSGLNNITCKPMMGEYLLYYKGILFGGIYDDSLLIKKTKTNCKYNLEEGVPYEGAKAMYLIEDLDDEDNLKKMIIDTYNDLHE